MTEPESEWFVYNDETERYELSYRFQFSLHASMQREMERATERTRKRLSSPSKRLFDRRKRSEEAAVMERRKVYQTDNIATRED